MNIRDKLARLDKSAGTKPLPAEENIVSEEWIDNFQRELDARILTGGNSFVILKENYYPAYSHPLYNGVRENEFRFSHFHRITNEPAARDFNLRRTLFIDLETTGLAGGTGTYAFLVGLGHIELDHIVVRQFLLPDFQHEWLLLQQVENNLQSIENIVSFNGKSYDIPLLRNRFILNRMDSLLDEKLHIDLLHLSRRLWKKRLTSCDLQNLEYVILGQERFSDVPGEMIPQIYFEYIRKREAVLLRQVLEHNFHDIVNLILLTMQVGQIVEDPLHTLTYHEDIFSLAKFYVQNNDTATAIPLLENVITNDADSLLRKEATLMLSLAQKKMGNFQRSSDLMKGLLQQQRDHPQAIVELAKYYEHKEKNYLAALQLVEQGIRFIETLEQLDRHSPLIPLKESLTYRYHRLQRKTRSQNTPD